MGNDENEVGGHTWCDKGTNHTSSIRVLGDEDNNAKGLYVAGARGCRASHPHVLLPAAILALAPSPSSHRAIAFVPIIVRLILASWSNLCSDAVDLRSLMIGQ